MSTMDAYSLHDVRAAGPQRCGAIDALRTVVPELAARLDARDRAWLAACCAELRAQLLETCADLRFARDALPRLLRAQDRVHGAAAAGHYDLADALIAHHRRPDRDEATECARDERRRARCLLAALQECGARVLASRMLLHQDTTSYDDRPRRDAEPLGLWAMRGAAERGDRLAVADLCRRGQSRPDAVPSPYDRQPRACLWVAKGYARGGHVELAAEAAKDLPPLAHARVVRHAMCIGVGGGAPETRRLAWRRLPGKRLKQQFYRLATARAAGKAGRTDVVGSLMRREIRATGGLPASPGACYSMYLIWTEAMRGAVRAGRLDTLRETLLARRSASGSAWFVLLAEAVVHGRLDALHLLVDRCVSLYRTASGQDAAAAARSFVDNVRRWFQKRLDSATRPRAPEAVEPGVLVVLRRMRVRQIVTGARHMPDAWVAQVCEAVGHVVPAQTPPLSGATCPEAGAAAAADDDDHDDDPYGDINDGAEAAGHGTACALRDGPRDAVPATDTE